MRHRNTLRIMAILLGLLIPTGTRAEEAELPSEETPAAEESGLGAEEINELLALNDYALIEAKLNENPELRQRFEQSTLDDTQRMNYLSLYKTFSQNESTQTNPGFLATDNSPQLYAVANAQSYDSVVQSGAFVLGDGVSENSRKFLYNGDGKSGDAVTSARINDRNPARPGTSDSRFAVGDISTLWIEHVGSWYGEPVGMAVHLIRNSVGNGSNQSIMLQPGDWGTNFYYEDIVDVTNVIELYKNVDRNNPHVNGEKIVFDSDYAIFAGSHGLTDEDLSWDGTHYRSSEAAGPVDNNMAIYTDHLDWIAKGTSTAGKTVYYSEAYRKTIRVSFDVSSLNEARFYLGVVTRGGAPEVSQDGGVDFNGWIDSAKHATFVVVDPNGGTYLNNAGLTNHEGLADETVRIEDSVRPGYIFKGYEFVQKLGTWDNASKTYTFGTPQKDGIKYGKLVAQWQKQSLQWKLEKAVDKAETDVEEELTYTLKMSSPATEEALDAETMTVRDIVPEHCTFVSASDEGTCIDGTVVWKLKNINRKNGKTVSFTVKVNSDIPVNTIPNSADFTVTNGNEKQIGVSNEVQTVLKEPVITIEKAVDKETCDLDEDLTYTLTVTNTGEGTARFVHISDPLPEGLRYTEGGVFNEEKKRVEFITENLKPRESRTFTWIAHTLPHWVSDTFTNTAYTSNTREDSGKEFNDDPQNPSNPVTTELKQPQITVTKNSLPETETTVDTESEITYTLIVSNTGEGTAPYIYINDPLSEHLEWVEGGTYDANTHSIAYLLTDVKPGNKITLSFKTRVKAQTEGQEIRNLAYYDWYKTSPGELFSIRMPIHETNITVHHVGVPKIEVIKSADPADGKTVRKGQFIEYTLTVKNGGTSKAAYTLVSDTIPEGTVLSSTNPYTAENNAKLSEDEKTVTWLIKDLKVNETVTLKLRVKVEKQEGMIENNADYDTFDHLPSEKEKPMKKTNKVTHKVTKLVPAVNTEDSNSDKLLHTLTMIRDFLMFVYVILNTITVRRLVAKVYGKE